MANHNIDTLNIKITSDAQSANKSLSALEGHLTRLSDQLSVLGSKSSGLNKFSAGVTQLSNAMIAFKNSGIKTADFTRLVSNLGALSTVDSAGIEATAKAITDIGASMSSLQTVSENAVHITELAKALSKLGSKNAGQAITNIPQLATAMRDLLTTLSESPQISSDVLRMTEALAEFVQGAKGYSQGVRQMESANAKISINIGYAQEALTKFGQTVKKVARTLVASPFKVFGASVKGLATTISAAINKIKGFATQSERAEKSVSKFAQTIGTLYVKFWLLARVLGKVFSAVKSSFDYLETVNYFTSSFEAIATKATNTMSDAGEESAQAFYKSFTDTATQLTRKMTGFDISGGQLQMTKGANLGLDPQTTLNYQTTFAQIASSMGVASDKAVMLSNVLTEIGADLASVKNMEFEEVWQNMASGLVGMSRAVDKFGINIRASAMQEKLFELGINTTVKELSQADKALLRTIMILDSSRYAWKDLAETLESPANQIRMLTANLHKLATMFGSLFLPVLKKVLPYLNAVVIALQRLMQTIMKVLGIDLSEMLPKGGAGASDALSDILDEAEGTGDALEDAQEQAKKLKNNLLGIDELNIINDNQDDALNPEDLSVNSLLDQAFVDAVSEYQKAWDEAFKNLENKAQEIADKIVEWAKKVWKPIGEAWDAVGDYVIDRWKYMTGELGKLFKDIARDWATVWAQEATEKIFENIFESVGNIFELVGNLARQFREAWNEGDKGLHILENIRDIVTIITDHVRKMTKSWADWAGSLDFNPLLQSIENLTGSIVNNLDDILNIVDDFQELFMQKAFTYIVESFLPRLLEILTSLVNDINWERLRGAFADIFTGLEKIFEFLGDTFLDKLASLETIVANLVNKYLPRLGEAFAKLGDDLQKAENINDVINALFDFADGRVVDVSEIINLITNAFNEAMDKIDFKNLGKRFGGLVNKLFETIDWKALGKAVSNIAGGFFELIHGALKEIKWFEVGQAIGNFLKGIEWGRIIKEVLSIVGDILGGIVSAWLGSLSTAPFETGILTLVGAVFAGGKIASGLSKIITGKGLGANLLSWIFGGNSDMGKESTLFEKIAEKAGLAAGAKDMFAQANGRVADSAEKSNGLLKYELQFFAESESKIGGFLKTLGGIALVGGGVAGVGYEFGKQWNDGVTVADVALTGLFGLMGAIGAIILGAPAGIALAVAGGVVAIGEGVLLLHEHWDDIQAWWNNTVLPAVTGFFEGIGEKFKGFADGIGQKWDDLKLVLSLQWDLIKEGFSRFIEEWGGKISEWATQKWEAITDKVEEIRGKIEQKWGEIKENFSTHILTWQGQITEWASAKWEDITNKLEEIRGGIQTKWEEMQQNFTDHIGAWHERITTWASERWDEITGKVAEVRDYIQDRWGEMKQHFEDHITHWRESITEWATSKWDEITTTMDTIKGEIYDRWELMKQDFDDFKERWKEKIGEWASNKWDAITDAMTELKGQIYEKWEDYKRDFTEFLGAWREKIGEWASEKWDSVVETLSKLKQDIGEKWEGIKEDASTFWGNFKTDLGGWAKNCADAVSNAFKGIKDTLSDAWGNIKTGAEKAFDSVKTTATNTWNNIKDTVKNVTSAVTGSNSLSSSMSKVSTTSSSKTTTSSPYKTTSLFDADNWKKLFNADGGFPEDGLFFANHSELVGRFSNGRTAVANNQQITDGIAQATYNAMMKANAESGGREEELLQELISAVRQGSKVVIDGREIVTAYDNRKARNGYSFA